MLGSPWTCLEIFPCQLGSHVWHREGDVPKARHSLTQKPAESSSYLPKKVGDNRGKTLKNNLRMAEGSLLNDTLRRACGGQSTIHNSHR